METLKIKINSFDMEKIFDLKKLEELKKNLENIQINKIKTNIKGNNDEIDIIYSEKEIKLNENLYFKVKLIRDKYYRQLLSILNTIIPPKGLFDLSEESAKYFYSHSHRYNNDKIKMALINYIGTYNFVNIYELSKEKMQTIKKYYENNPNIIVKDIHHALGMYCHYDKYLIKELEKSELEKIKECDKFILICSELIHEFCIDNFEKFKQYGITDIYKLYDIIFDKVLSHEIGHGVFEYIDDLDNERCEKRANYFASITFDGTYDKIIKTMTDLQGGEYKNPYLIEYDIKVIKNEVYGI